VCLKSMKMVEDYAKQIAALINEQNQLPTTYSKEDIIEEADKYVWIVEEDVVLACAEVEKVQWYQCEISHVSVKVPRKGYGQRILELAEEKAKKVNAKITQCTIRSTNIASIGLFEKNGYLLSTSFLNPVTGNTVNVFQKSIAPV
jgi:N-acetylglutamate synthase-like GNAT family acetyltransferase